MTPCECLKFEALLEFWRNNNLSRPIEARYSETKLGDNSEYLKRWSVTTPLGVTSMDLAQNLSFGRIDP